MSDRETLQMLREIAAGEAGLPPTLADRVSGSTIGAMRSDAKQLALDLGYAEPAAPQARNERGQFARGESDHQAFNSLIRAASGRTVVDDEPSEQPVADLGIGKGAGATPMTRGQPSMSERIRAAAAVRSGVLPVEQLVAEGPL